MAEKYMTGYELAKEVNKRLEELGLATIPTQMVYNYMKNPTTLRKAVETIQVQEKGTQRVLNRQKAMEWLEKYVEAKKERQNTQK
jgi:UDP-N-acetylmuramyl tripeptide synthase